MIQMAIQYSSLHTMHAHLQRTCLSPCVCSAYTLLCFVSYDVLLYGLMYALTIVNWAWQDLNLQPKHYECSALTIELQAPLHQCHFTIHDNSACFTSVFHDLFIMMKHVHHPVHQLNPSMITNNIISCPMSHTAAWHHQCCSMSMP